MARHVFVLTGLLVVLMAAGRVGIHADSSFLDGPVIPMPLAEATGPHPDLVTKTQTAGQGSSSGTAAAPTETVPAIEMPGTAFRVLHLFQYDGGTTKPGAAPTKDKPVSVVVWRALEVGAKVSPRELRERISENSAAASMTGKAVYTLQPDYKLQKLALSTAEIDHVFSLLQAGKGDTITADSLWKGKVAGQLKEVEWLDDGSHKNKNKNAKTGKDKSAKDAKPAKARPEKSATAKTSKSVKTASAEAPSHAHKKIAKA